MADGAKKAKEEGRQNTVEPMCWSKPCPASEVMLPELGTWIGMYNLLKAEVLSGCQMSILERGKVTEGDFEVFASLDNTVNMHRIERQEQERRSRG